MISRTKNLQTEESIGRMVKLAFHGKKFKEIRELTEGFFNVAYLVKLSDDKEVILKIAPPKDVVVMSYEKELMFAEVSSLRLVKKMTNVPIPQVLYYSGDEGMVEKNKNIFCDAPYFFMSKLEGTTYSTIKSSLTEQEKYEIEYELGLYNRQMNAIKGDYFGYYTRECKKSTDWKTEFYNMLEMVFQDGINKNINIGIDYNQIKELIHKFSFALETVSSPKFIHWDLWEGNVFVKDGHIEGIIDFERSLWGDPLMEYAFRQHNKNVASGFFKGYGEMKQDLCASIRCNLYDIYLYLIMTIECVYRQYPDNNQYEWAKKMLAEAISRLQQMKS